MAPSHKVPSYTTWESEFASRFVLFVCVFIDIYQVLRGRSIDAHHVTSTFLQVLMEKASVEQRKDLITGYDMLTNPRKMGERFKFMALLRERPNNYKPAGFSQPT